jgi:hypothetical protein
MLDEPCAILKDNIREEVAFDDKIEFCSARVDVGGIKATRTEKANGNCTTLAYERRESSMVCACDVPSISFSDAFCEGWVVELEDILVVGEEFGALNCVGGEDELLEKR